MTLSMDGQTHALVAMGHVEFADGYKNGLYLYQYRIRICYVSYTLTGSWLFWSGRLTVSSSRPPSI